MAVAILGPRQSGKTTLSKNFKGIYFDLEQAEERAKLDIEWDRIINEKKLIILDEAQSFPEIFPRIRGQIDAQRKKNGRFLLLGSVSPRLMVDVSESLAGRLAICEITPFNYFELKSSSINNHWLMGGYPDGGILKTKSFPHWQTNYINLLSQRDLPNWGLTSKPKETERLIKMLAHMNGNILNLSQIGKNLGISYHTVKSYIDYLQMAYIVRILHPFHANINKRLIKSPKIYFRDSGLLHATLGINDYESLLVHPCVGNSFEGYIIEQILSYLVVKGIDFEPYFFRTSDGREIDLFIEIKGKSISIEIKLSSSIRPEDMRRLEKTASLLKSTVTFLISKTEKQISSEKLISTNLDKLPNLLDNILNVSL